MTKKSHELTTRINEKIEALASLTDAAAQSESVIEFMKTLAKFYAYSLNNVFLIMIQNPDASRVAGYMDWKNKFKRQVKKGEHGITILAPSKYKRCNLAPSDPEFDPNSKSYVIKGFRAVTVFDIEQTEGEDLPEAPNWKSPEKNEELTARLIEFAEKNQIKVEISEDLPEGAQGCSTGGLIKLAPEAGTKTLIHELAHELLHQENKTTSAVMELEAESIAFVVGYTFGLKDLASPNYLALWEADAAKIREKASRIRETAILIIRGVS